MFPSHNLPSSFLFIPVSFFPHTDFFRRRKHDDIRHTTPSDGNSCCLSVDAITTIQNCHAVHGRRRSIAHFRSLFVRPSAMIISGGPSILALDPKKIPPVRPQSNGQCQKLDRATGPRRSYCSTSHQLQMTFEDSNLFQANQWESTFVPINSKWHYP